jgi:hypothetical protein
MKEEALRGVIDTVRNVFRSEQLEDLPTRHIDPFRRDFFSWLFGREALAQDEPPALRKGQPFFSWLFGPEQLAEAPPAPRAARTPFLETLFAGEDLPLDEKPEHAGGRGAAPPDRDRRAG